MFTTEINNDNKTSDTPDKINSMLSMIDNIPINIPGIEMDDNTFHPAQENPPLGISSVNLDESKCENTNEFEIFSDCKSSLVDIRDIKKRWIDDNPVDALKLYMKAVEKHIKLCGRLPNLIDCKDIGNFILNLRKEHTMGYNHPLELCKLAGINNPLSFLTKDGVVKRLVRNIRSVYRTDIPPEKDYYLYLVSKITSIAVEQHRLNRKPPTKTSRSKNFEKKIHEYTKRLKSNRSGSHIVDT